MLLVDHFAQTARTYPDRVFVHCVGEGAEGDEVLSYGDAMRESTRDGWFHTRDQAYADEAGRFYFVDRLKDIVRRGGEDISAHEIEQVIAWHAEVAEAAVVPKPHPVLGETVAVFLVPKNAGRRFDTAEMRAYRDGRLPEFMWPEDVRTARTDDLLRTPTGRVRRFLLEERLRAEQRGSPA